MTIGVFLHTKIRFLERNLRVKLFLSLALSLTLCGGGRFPQAEMCIRCRHFVLPVVVVVALSVLVDGVRVGPLCVLSTAPPGGFSSVAFKGCGKVKKGRSEKQTEYSQRAFPRNNLYT